MSVAEETEAMMRRWHNGMEIDDRIGRHTVDFVFGGDDDDVWSWWCVDLLF